MARSRTASKAREIDPAADGVEPCTCDSGQRLQIADAAVKRLEGLLRDIKALIEQFEAEGGHRRHNDWFDLEELEKGAGQGQADRRNRRNN